MDSTLSYGKLVNPTTPPGGVNHPPPLKGVTLPPKNDFFLRWRQGQKIKGVAFVLNYLFHFLTLTI